MMYTCEAALPLISGARSVCIYLFVFLYLTSCRYDPCSLVGRLHVGPGYERGVEVAAVCAQGLVTLFVMIGLGIVFGLPYLVARNRRMRKERGSGSAPSALSNILELTRKRGHVN
jgi:hypothetical protein